MNEEENSKTKEFEKNSGGIENLLYASFYLKNGTKEPNCVCGQISYTMYKIVNANTKNIHWVGTCCINKYLKTQGFGGKYGIKQGSYKQLLENIRQILSNVQIDRNLDRILKNLSYKIISSIEDKQKLEEICGCEIRFDVGDVSYYEEAYINNEIAEKHGYSLEEYITWRIAHKW